MADSYSRRALGSTLRALRHHADLSQRELAKRAGVPASTVARIESGHAEDPKFRTIERLAQRRAGSSPSAWQAPTRRHHCPPTPTRA